MKWHIGALAALALFVAVFLTPPKADADHWGQRITVSDRFKLSRDFEHVKRHWAPSVHPDHKKHVHPYGSRDHVTNIIIIVNPPPVVIEAPMTWVPAQWVWDGWQWVWMPGYWTR